MAQFAEDKQKQHEAENISCLMSVLMSIAAVTWMFVMGTNFPDHKWLIITPAMALLIAAMWFIVKPAKVEY